MLNSSASNTNTETNFTLRIFKPPVVDMLTGLSGDKFTLPHFWRFVIVENHGFHIADFHESSGKCLWTHATASSREATPNLLKMFVT